MVYNILMYKKRADIVLKQYPKAKLIKETIVDKTDYLPGGTACELEITIDDQVDVIHLIHAGVSIGLS